MVGTLVQRTENESEVYVPLKASTESYNEKGLERWSSLYEQN